jgi:hypothetical protein
MVLHEYPENTVKTKDFEYGVIYRPDSTQK